MENTTSYKKQKRSKGDRLNWTPVWDVKPVKLKECSTSFSKVSKRELIRLNKDVKILLIP